MKVKELVEKLQNYNPEAEIIICYEHKLKGEKPQCYYKHVDDINYQQKLEKDKLIVDKNIVHIWCE